MKKTKKQSILSESLVDAVKGGSIFADVMLGENFLTRLQPTVSKEYKRSKYSADRNVKVCPECNRTWESIKRTSTSHKITFYYKDMPRYKKPFKLCKNCKGDNNE